jgi:NTP pyrophosphatase (non-canonical NTP hydrolase)
MKKIKTLAEYQQLASRTCPDLGSDRLNIFHMNTGIITEIGEAVDPIKKKIAYGKEIDLINVGEEIADAAWYIANRARMFLEESQNSIIWGSFRFSDLITQYEEDFKKELAELITPIDTFLFVADLLHSIRPQSSLEEADPIEAVGLPCMTLLYKAAELLGLDFWQLLTNNIAKLQVRYPEKFTNEAALNRNLEAERAELEKVAPDENTEGRV